MSLKGDLREYPLPEVLCLLAGKSGTILFRSLPEAGQFDLHIDGGFVCGCEVNGNPLRRDPHIVDKLISATLVRAGSFEYSSLDPAGLPHRNRLPLGQLALSVASSADHIVARAESLPDAGMLFRWIGNPASFKGHDPALDCFIEDAHDLLVFGADANRLSEFLRVAVLLAQDYLARLEQIGGVLSLHRDRKWSQMDKSLKAKLATPITVVREDGSKKTINPPRVIIDPKRMETHVTTDLDQKVVPVLRPSGVKNGSNS